MMKAIRTTRRRKILPLLILSKGNWQNDSASRSRNSNRRWVKSFQISFFTDWVMRRLPGNVVSRSARWAFI